jgi:DNA-binding response OmpR family regulator
MRVLIVEDEQRLAQNIARALREGPGYAVDLAEDGETGELLLNTDVYDAVILDLMLPKKSGVDLLSALRHRGKQTPVLVLTARAEKAWTVRLLDAGADDYLAKPFDLGELIARVKALVRRGKGVAHPVIRAGELELDTQEKSVRRRGEGIDLSPTEYRILEYLMHRRRAVVSKRELLEHLYDYNWERHSNVVEAHISNLRRKLGQEGEDDSLIETLRGRGYRIAPEMRGAESAPEEPGNDGAEDPGQEQAEAGEPEAAK